MKISYYKKVNSINPINIDIYKALETIKNGTYSETIKNVRFLINDNPKRTKEKLKLPLLGFGGTFTARGNNNLIQSSGLACLDFDHVEDVLKLKEKVNKDKYTFSSFISPSGDGLKTLIKIPLVGNDLDYKGFYIALQSHYNKYAKTDDVTKDIARATFVSYDADLYINSESVTFTDRFIPKKIKPKQKIINISLVDENEIAEKLIVWFHKKWTTGQNRNNNLFKLSSAFNVYGLEKSLAFSYCMQYISTDFKEIEIRNLVNSAYKYTNDFNTKSFEDKKKIRGIEKLAVSGSKIDHVKKIFGNSEGVINEFKKVSEKLDASEFWYYTEKEVIKLATFRFLNYLENNNISKYYPDENSDTFLFIKKQDNFISVFGETKIKDFTLSDLRNRGQIEAFELMANNNNTFSSRYLSMINTIDITLKKDTKKHSFVYYKNGVIETTKDGCKKIEYKEIDGLIWKNQVINRDIELNDNSEGEFKTFLWKISDETPDRYYTLKSVIGYLLHSFQDESKPKAIIFNDELVSDDVPNGGSGKGLIHKAIGYIKNIVTENGKKFDPKSQFAYQKVNKDTQIFLLDDVPKNFIFESLFSIITEGMTVEKKGQDAYQIPFYDSPKISITTNYTIKGDGASFLRRVFEVEIANFFNENRTPEDEFGHQFFTDWDVKEWAKFDNFMLRCIQYFLKHGLVGSEKVNLDFRKIKNNLGAEFIEFMESKPLSVAISRKQVRDNFNSQYPTIARYNTAQKFNKKIKEYCLFYELELLESKFNGIISYQILDDNTPPF